MQRISILRLMGVVGIIAVGMTALRNADEFWQGIVITLTMGVLGVAVLGIWQLRDADQAWWGGFAGFGFGYLILALAPWADANIGPITATGYLLSSANNLAMGGTSAYYFELAELEQRQKSLTDWLAARRAEAGGTDDAGMKSAVAEMQSLATRISNARLAEPSGPKRLRSMLPGSIQTDEFRRIGHCLFALAAGWFGAVVSRSMWARREAQSPRPTPIDDLPA